MIYTARILHALAYWPIYLFLRLAVGYRVEGQENINGLGYLKKAPIIFVSNHASYLDGPISAAAMPRQGFCPWDFYPVRFIVADRFFNLLSPIYFLSAICLRLNAAISVHRAKGDLDRALGGAIKAVKDDFGTRFWIYPEGGLSLDGKLREGRRGAAYLAQKIGATVVPVGISGNFGIASMKHIFRRGTRVKVKFGNPFVIPEIMSAEEGTALIMARIADLIEIEN